MKISNRRFVPTTAIFRFFNQADNTKKPAPAKNPDKVKIIRLLYKIRSKQA